MKKYKFVYSMRGNSKSYSSTIYYLKLKYGWKWYFMSKKRKAKLVNKLLGLDQVEKDIKEIEKEYE